MNISESLKGCYQKFNSNQVSLAKGINVTKSYVSAIERADKSAPIGFIVKCSNYFGIKVSEFIAMGEE
jgi:transcriptional regulator with XRE-family HTH domain